MLRRSAARLCHRDLPPPRPTTAAPAHWLPSEYRTSRDAEGTLLSYDCLKHDIPKLLSAVQKTDQSVLLKWAALDPAKDQKAQAVRRLAMSDLSVLQQIPHLPVRVRDSGLFAYMADSPCTLPLDMAMRMGWFTPGQLDAWLRDPRSEHTPEKLRIILRHASGVDLHLVHKGLMISRWAREHPHSPAHCDLVRTWVECAGPQTDLCMSTLAEMDRWCTTCRDLVCDRIARQNLPEDAQMVEHILIRNAKQSVTMGPPYLVQMLRTMYASETSSRTVSPAFLLTFDPIAIGFLHANPQCLPPRAVCLFHKRHGWSLKRTPLKATYDVLYLIGQHQKVPFTKALPAIGCKNMRFVLLADQDFFDIDPRDAAYHCPKIPELIRHIDPAAVFDEPHLLRLLKKTVSIDTTYTLLANKDPGIFARFPGVVCFLLARPRLKYRSETADRVRRQIVGNMAGLFMLGQGSDASPLSLLDQWLLRHILALAFSAPQKKKKKS